MLIEMKPMDYRFWKRSEKFEDIKDKTLLPMQKSPLTAKGVRLMALGASRQPHRRSIFDRQW